MEVLASDVTQINPSDYNRSGGPTLVTVIVPCQVRPIKIWFGPGTKLKDEMKASDGFKPVVVHGLSCGLECRGKAFSVGQTLRQCGLWDTEGPLIMHAKKR